MPRTILLADDSVTAQNMGKKILSDAGFEVITVSNGSAALKKAIELIPDIAVLDVYMPGYSGLEVCKQLKENAKTADIPMTANRVGSMFTWFFQPGEIRDWDTAEKSDTKAFGNFFRGMLDNGIYLPPSQFEAAFMSATHSESDIEATVTAARKSLQS